MLLPDLYCGEWGQKKYKDGTNYLLKQHTCGDWQIIRHVLPDELTHFATYGQKPEKVELPCPTPQTPLPTT